MKLIIFGATGSVGRLLVSQALALGHSVTAFARRPQKLAINHKNLRLAAGDALNAEQVSAAVAGHDMVLCALGAGRKGKIRSEGTANIIKAMKSHDIRRFICQSTLGAGDSRGNLNFFWRHLMFGMFLKEAYEDHEAQETLVEQSGLEWVIVRPAAFTNGPAAMAYKHGFGANDNDLTLKISRADVADFMLRQLEDDRYLYRKAGLSYAKRA